MSREWKGKVRRHTSSPDSTNNTFVSLILGLLFSDSYFQNVTSLLLSDGCWLQRLQNTSWWLRRYSEIILNAWQTVIRVLHFSWCSPNKVNEDYPKLTTSCYAPLNHNFCSRHHCYLHFGLTLVRSCNSALYSVFFNALIKSVKSVKSWKQDFTDADSALQSFWLWWFDLEQCPSLVFTEDVFNNSKNRISTNTKYIKDRVDGNFQQSWKNNLTSLKVRYFAP